MSLIYEKQYRILHSISHEYHAHQHTLIIDVIEIHESQQYGGLTYLCVTPLHRIIEQAT